MSDKLWYGEMRYSYLALDWLADMLAELPIEHPLHEHIHKAHQELYVLRCVARGMLDGSDKNVMRQLARAWMNWCANGIAICPPDAMAWWRDVQELMVDDERKTEMMEGQHE